MKSKFTSKELKKRTKKKLSILGKKRRQFIKLICPLCKRPYKIRINNKSKWTSEIINKWTCLLCK